MNKETGGPAFPNAYFYDEAVEGMSLRDWFAGKAMQAFLTRETKFNQDLMMYAGAAYDVADAMLEARKQ